MTALFIMLVAIFCYACVARLKSRFKKPFGSCQSTAGLLHSECNRPAVEKRLPEGFLFPSPYPPRNYVRMITSKEELLHHMILRFSVSQLNRLFRLALVSSHHLQIYRCYFLYRSPLFPLQRRRKSEIAEKQEMILR
jgi:hypothetical protein